MSAADRAEAHPILGPILHGACLTMGLALLWLGLVVL